MLLTAALLLGVAPRVRAVALPFVEDFDALANGSLNGQNGWEATPAAQVQVQSAILYGGARAGSSTNATFLRRFDDPKGTNVWIDFYARPSRRTAAAPPTPSQTSAAAFYIDGSGHVVARSNATWVTLSSYSVPENAWTRFTLHVDYPHDRWAIYVAGSTSNALATTLATNLALQATSTGAYVTQFRVSSTNGAGVQGLMSKGYLDEFTVANHADSGTPQAVDSDSDGLSDRWETEYLGGLNNSDGGSTDTDNDGWTDTREQIAGTHPGDNASYLQFIDIDLVSETSSDLAITVRGGWAASRHRLCRRRFGAAAHRAGSPLRDSTQDNGGGRARSPDRHPYGDRPKRGGPLFQPLLPGGRFLRRGVRDQYGGMGRLRAATSGGFEVPHLCARQLRIRCREQPDR